MVTMFPDGLTEEQAEDLPLETAISVNVSAVYHQLPKLLEALPYPTYLRCLASFMEDLCTYYGDEVYGEGEHLVRKTILLVREAANGRQVTEEAEGLSAEWVAYMGYPQEGDMVETDLPLMLDWLCVATIDGLTDPEYRYYAASVAADAADKASRTPEVLLDNVRLLLKWSIRARRMAEG
jgi:hypothetical protein